jgi:hypothetical protein
MKDREIFMELDSRAYGKIRGLPGKACIPGGRVPQHCLRCQSRKHGATVYEQECLELGFAFLIGLMAGGLVMAVFASGGC